MTFRSVALAGMLLLAAAIAHPSPANATSGGYITVNPYNATYYYGPRYRYYYPPRYYGYVPYYNYYPYYYPRPYYYVPRYRKRWKRRYRRW